MPSFNAKVSGVNAATAGVPSPPRDSSLVSTSRAGPPGVSTPVSAVAGLQHRPLVGQPQLEHRGAAFGSFGLGGGFEDTGGVEVLDLELLDGCRAHGSIQAATTDTRAGPEPLVHRDSRANVAGFRGSSLALLAPQPTGASAPLETRWRDPVPLPGFRNGPTAAPRTSGRRTKEALGVHPTDAAADDRQVGTVDVQRDGGRVTGVVHAVDVARWHQPRHVTGERDRRAGLDQATVGGEAVARLVLRPLIDPDDAPGQVVVDRGRLSGSQTRATREKAPSGATCSTCDRYAEGSPMRCSGSSSPELVSDGRNAAQTASRVSDVVAARRADRVVEVGHEGRQVGWEAGGGHGCRFLS